MSRDLKQENFPHCPSCGIQEGVRMTMWGYPAEEPDCGVVTLGGCCITEDDPIWSCELCWTQWGSRAVEWRAESEDGPSAFSD